MSTTARSIVATIFKALAMPMPWSNNKEVPYAGRVQKVHRTDALRVAAERVVWRLATRSRIVRLKAKHRDAFERATQKSFAAGWNTIKDSLDHAIDRGDAAVLSLANDAILITQHELKTHLQPLLHGAYHEGGSTAARALVKQLMRSAGGPGSGPRKGQKKVKDEKQDPTGVVQLGVVGKEGVEVANSTLDNVGIVQHDDVGLPSARPEKRFRFVEGEVMWNETPSKEDFFKVDDRYSKYKNVEHFVSQGERMVPLHESSLRDAAKSVDFEFDADNMAAKEWAELHAGELVSGISKTTRDDIKDAVSSLFDNLDFDKGDLYDELQSILDDEDGTRSALIADNEVLTALNEGQRDAWDEAIDAGLLTGRENRVWIASEKSCDLCADMDGQETDGMDGVYDFDGEEIDGPPGHVRCECTEGLVM